MRAEPAHPHPLLVQVLPQGQGGVFDYMQCLKTEWSALGVASHAISLSKELARQRSLADRIDDHAADVLQPCSVVLHFSGYGYGQRGLCFWLLDELRALRARGRGGLRLVVVFHELFATGPPWRSAFWLSQVQALIARRLARMSDALWTNTNQHARWLREAGGSSRQIVVRPVFSNIGEPLASPPTTGRRPTAVVFGSASTRQRAFDALRGHETTLRRLGIEELVEAGNGAMSKGTPTAIACRHAGRLDPPELRQLLLDSRFGLLDYPSTFLGKSGVFAACAAHGCVVIDTSPPGPDTDGLVAGTDYLSLPAMAGALSLPAAHAAMAARLMHWYADHRLAGQARDLLALAVASS